MFNRIISLSGAYYEASQEIIAREKELSHLNVWMTEANCHPNI
jgi:hypothetical protein